MKRYDAIIAGGGPAGTAAAYQLASGGADVLLLERAHYPRPKVCGGALSARISSVIGDGFMPLVKSTVFGADLVLGSEEPISVRAALPVAHLVLRTEFDEWMAHRAAAAGAEIREGILVRSAEEEPGGVLIRTSGGPLHARFLIAADGAPSRIGRRFGLGPALPQGVAIEGEARRRPGGSPDGGDVLTIDLAAAAGGYGWVFPKAGRVSFGVAGHRERVEDLHHAFDRFVLRTRSLSDLGEYEQAGHLIPAFGEPIPRIAEGSVLAVGDAAGLVDPFLGEGIYYAVLSGRVAGHALLAGADGSAGRRYESRIARTLYPEFRAAARLAEMIYRYPHIAFYIFRDRPDLAREYLEVLAGRSDYVSFWRRVKRQATPEFLRYRLFGRVAS